MKNNLKVMRLRAGLTQKALGKILGRPQSFIGRVESGSVALENMTIRNCYQIAEVLGCRMEDLIGMPYLSGGAEVQSKVQ